MAIMEITGKRETGNVGLVAAGREDGQRKSKTR